MTVSLSCECRDCRAWQVRKRNVTWELSALSLGMLVIGGLVISGLLR